MAEIGKDIAAFVKTVDEHRRKFSRFAAARNGWEPWGNITFARESADGKSVEVCAGYFLGLQAPSRPERSVKAFFRIDALGNIFPAEPLAVFPYAEKFCNIMESDNYFW